MHAWEYGERRESCSAQPYWMPPETMQAKNSRSMLMPGLRSLLALPLSTPTAFSTSMDCWPVHATRLATSSCLPSSSMAAAARSERARGGRVSLAAIKLSRTRTEHGMAVGGGHGGVLKAGDSGWFKACGPAAARRGFLRFLHEAYISAP
jgi:hypothetical protein